MNTIGPSDDVMEFDESPSSFPIRPTSDKKITLEDSTDKNDESPIKTRDQNFDTNLGMLSDENKKKDISSINPEFQGTRPRPNANYSNKKVKVGDKHRDTQARAAEKRMHNSHDISSPKKKEMKQKSSLTSTSLEGNSSKLDLRSPCDKVWAGSPISDFPHLSPSNLNVPPLAVSPDHEVYVKLPLNDGEIPLPYPDTYHDVWDCKHVRMPNSNESLNLIKMSNGKSKLVKRWPMIFEALSKEINSVSELHQAILFYNPRYQTRWRFDGLKFLLEEDFAEEEHNYFFKKLLPKIINLAISLPKIVTRPPVLLGQKCTKSISLSQIQIACLLANAFLCTYPRRNARGSSTEYAKYPDINFNRLFFHKDPSAIEKMKCIINYFKEVLDRDPDGMVTFTRQYIPPSEIPKFEECNKSLPKFHINSEGFIEEMPGLLQVDFANKYIGGGVLGLGCVQEEIRFVLCPELLVSMLFTEVLDKHEALIVTGVEQYNKSKGYASSFEWVGTFHDVTLRDSFKRRLCQVVGIDALYFSRNPANQYKEDLIRREIEKAYIGFRVLPGSLGTPTGIASGNWGCGAFRGDPKLKSLIQLVAAGVAGRDLAYFTFGDEKLRNGLAAMHQFLTENSVTIGELVMVLCQYGMCRKNVGGKDLYMYIQHNIKGYNSDTDSDSCGMDGIDEADAEVKLPKIPKKKLDDNIEETSIEKMKIHSPKQSEQNLTASAKPPAPKCITDYFKAAPRVANYPQNVADADDKYSVPAKKHTPIPPDKLAQALSECDKLTYKPVVEKNETSILTSKYFERRTSDSCESSNVNVADNTGSTDGLFDKLNKYDQKID